MINWWYFLNFHRLAKFPNENLCDKYSRFLMGKTSFLLANQAMNALKALTATMDNH